MPYWDDDDSYYSVNVEDRRDENYEPDPRDYYRSGAGLRELGYEIEKRRRAGEYWANPNQQRREPFGLRPPQPLRELVVSGGIGAPSLGIPGVRRQRANRERQGGKRRPSQPHRCSHPRGSRSAISLSICRATK